RPCAPLLPRRAAHAATRRTKKEELNRTRTEASDRPWAASTTLRVRFDVLDGVTDGADLLRFLVGDLGLELFFHRHDQLDDVERVGAQVLDELGFGLDLLLGDAQLVGDDGTDARFDGHVRSPGTVVLRI